MEEPVTPGPGPEGNQTRRPICRDLALLALLLALAAAIRVGIVWRTEVPARDSIGFVRYAIWLHDKGWQETVRNQHQHPGYPLAVLAASLPVRPFFDEAHQTFAFLLSAQLASAAAGVLLVMPMFYLGKVLLDRGAGFWGALLFQCLPTSGHVLSDGTSDPLFLLMLATALLFALLAVRHRSLAWFTLAGVWCGLAYLTRPEGVLVLLATGMAVLGCQAVAAWRQPWRSVLASGAAMGLAALVVGSPYFLAVGGFTNKPVFKIGLHGGEQPTTGTPVTAGPLLACVWAVHLPGAEQPLAERLSRAGWLLGGEFARCYQYVGWVPVLMGLWWYRRRYRQMPEAWVLIALIVLDALVLCWVPATAGYLSDRHVMVLILCTIFQAVGVVRELPYRLRAWLALRPSPWASAVAWSLVLLLAWAGAGLSEQTRRPLHYNRAGHRPAGLWLAGHTHPADVIIDDHCYAHYYAGRVFQEEKPLPQDGHSPRTYVVISRGKEDRAPTHAYTMTEDQARRAGGRLVYHWPEDRPAEKARVVIFRLPKS
jgi:hypothetical protein